MKHEEKPRIMILGGAGLLGQKMVEVVKRETDWQVVLATRGYLVDDEGGIPWDSMSKKSWREAVVSERWRPSIIVNAAAMTNVDACEDNRKEAWQNNVDLVEIIAEMCRKVDARLVQISTDYVHDGDNGPYLETDTPNPINYYGKTKLAAENVCIRSGIDHVILRTMWLYGDSDTEKNSFVDWLVASSREGKEVQIVNDEWGCPTLTDDVAYATVKAIEKNIQGIINVAGDERVSRWDWAQTICDVYGINDRSRIIPVTSADLARKAPRPLNSGLINVKARMMLGISTTGVYEGTTTYKIHKERRATGIQA